MNRVYNLLARPQYLKCEMKIATENFVNTTDIPTIKNTLTDTSLKQLDNTINYNTNQKL